MNPSKHAIPSPARRTLMKALAAGALFSPLLGRAASAAPHIEVYKSAGCGCCKAWITHLEQNGFTVGAHDVPSPGDYREKAGMPKELGSCHTGLIDGYAIEGHVPAADIKRLLAAETKGQPKARGLAVPSMPMGAPGMEGGRADPFDVFLVDAQGQRSVFAHYASGSVT
jgi:hypothetical protein